MRHDGEYTSLRSRLSESYTQAMTGEALRESESGQSPRAANRGAPGETPFFIIGAGRSGTTLLQAMLTRSSRIAIPPETHFFSRFDPAIRFCDPLGEAQIEPYLRWVAAHPWWGELGLDAQSLREHLNRGERSAASILLWMLRALAGGGALRLGEKTPRHEKHLPRILEVFPDARIIHMHRDPRDVVASLQREPWMAGRSAQRIARHVRDALARQSRAARQMGRDRYAVVRYETLVSQPERELRRLCEFLGESFDERMLRFYEREDAGYLASEAGWKSLTLAPLDPSRHGRYRTLLSMRDIRAVERVMGTLLAEYGYEREPGPRDRLAWRARDAFERGRWWLERMARSVSKRLGGDASYERDRRLKPARLRQRAGAGQGGAGAA